MRSVADFQQVTPQWKHCRIVHSKYPPRNLFDDDDLENAILGELAADTSDRLCHPEWFVREEDIRQGDGWGPVMAAFCYPGEGRFSGAEMGSGAYYAANDVNTAIAEWCFHTAREWRRFGYSSEVSVIARCYKGDVALPLLDVRPEPSFHDSDDYTASQAFASMARAAGVNGLLYRSVRSEGGECIALFRPPATSSVKQTKHYVCIFDGDRFTGYSELGRIISIL